MFNEIGVKIAVALTLLQIRIKEFFNDEDGEVNIISMIIILAIAIALAIILRKQLKALFDSIWSSINTDTSSALENY